MQQPSTRELSAEATAPVTTRVLTVEPDFSGTPQPIADFAGRADFPQCALGAYIDIQGFAGVVIEIVGQSIKVRPPEGITQRFNANRLRTLHAPTVRREPVAITTTVEDLEPVATAEPARKDPEPPARVFIAEPDFTAPLRVINEYASQPGFPQCAHGKHVDILGYTGVVVEIVKGSLKIQSPAGITRSYNADILKRIYGKT